MCKSAASVVLFVGVECYRGFVFAAELVVDRGIELRYVGGIYAGNVKPTPFLCLSLKLLQIQPEKDIIVEFIRQEEYK